MYLGVNHVHVPWKPQVVLDAHYEWLEVTGISSTTAMTVKTVL